MAERPAYVETSPRSWLGIMGQWRSAEADVSFVGADATWQSGGRQIGIGVAASDIEKFADGEITATISFGEGTDSGFTAGLVLGFRSFGDQFYYVEIGDQNGFSVAVFEPGSGFRALARSGGGDQIRSGRDYKVKGTLRGQLVELRVNDVKVVEAILPRQTSGRQVAVIASGQRGVDFKQVVVKSARPRAFVATQFTAPFDRIWDKVIREAADIEGYEPVRIDEVAGTNPILADIKRYVAEATVVIAEITPANTNVFYEIGFADALNKPLVLLAQTGTKLPFDIQGYRTIFYEDVIGGEVKLNDELRKQLRALL